MTAGKTTLKNKLHFPGKKLVGVIPNSFSTNRYRLTKALSFVGRYCALFSFILVGLSSCHSGKQTKSKADMIDSLLDRATDSVYTNPSATLSLLGQARQMATDSFYINKVKSEYIRYYISKDSVEKAYLWTQELLTYASKQSSTPEGHGLWAIADNYMGYFQNQMCNLDSAVYYYLEAYKHAYRSIDKSLLPDICINIADMYIHKGDYINSIGYYRKALLISDTLHLEDKIQFPVFFGLGQAYLGLRNFELSDSYFRAAGKMYAGRTLNEKFTFCNNRGNYYYYKEEYANALPWFKKARDLVTPSDYQFYINLCEANMGDIYFHLNQTDSANFYLNKAFRYFTDNENKTILYYIATVKAGLELKNGRTGEAYKLLSQYKNSSTMEPEIISIRNKYLQEYYRMTGNYQEAYAYQARNIRLNDSIRDERIKNRIAEMDIRYRQDTTLIKKEMTIREQSAQIKTLRLSNYFWISLIVIFLLIAALASYIIISRTRINRIKQLERNTRLRLESIRNRISPHFIFNVLNHEISSEEDATKHNELIRLAKFLRRSLEMTEKLSVTLAEELDFVRNYVQLYRTELGSDFEWSEEINEKIHPDEWNVPAMIIQIPVENAIKHALRPKTGEKLLRLYIDSTDDRLHIVIQDNGKGFQPEKMVPTKGTGTGLKVMLQTIYLLNEKNSDKITFKIGSDHNDSISGTKVEIVIPKQYDFQFLTTKRYDT